MLEITKEATASALYVSNILFAQNAQNYFGSDPNKSPFLHTWSLGVEEQFYLLWPFVVFAILLVTRRRPHIHRRVAIAVLAVIVVGSFALNLRLTGEGSTWAFFSLPTRAWEFAAGGILGIDRNSKDRSLPSWRRSAGSLGSGCSSAQLNGSLRIPPIPAPMLWCQYRRRSC